MARKSWFAVSLICFFATIQSGWSQNSLNRTISIDSAISLTNQMLSPKMIDQAKFRIDSLMTLASSQKNQNNLLINLEIRSLYGKYLLLKQQYENWDALYLWCKNIEALCHSEEELNLLVRLYNNAGIAFKRMERYSDSEEAYLRSSEVLRRLKTPDYILYGSVYANAGNALRLIGEYEKSSGYLKQSIEYFDQFVGATKNFAAMARIAEPKSKALENLGLVYKSLGENLKAIEVYKTTIELKLNHFPKGIEEVYGNLVTALIEIGKLEEARHYNEQIINRYRPGSQKDRSWAMAKFYQSDINLRITEDTCKFFHESDILNSIIRREIPTARDVLIVANQLTTNLLLHQRKYQVALNHWSQAVKSLSSTNQDISPEDIPYHINTLNFNKLIELMILNAQIFFDQGLYFEDCSKLKKAEERYTFTLKLIDSLRNSLELQSSKLQVSRMQRSTYNQLIELEYKIFQLTGDSTYIEKIFTTMEQSKSAGLWSSVRDIEFKNSIIPSEYLEKEQYIRKKVADIRGKIIEASMAQNIDEQKIKELEEENLFYSQQIDSLKLIYRQKYPDYYKTKFDQSTITLGMARGLLSEDQTLIEYAIAYGYLYTLSATRAGSAVTRVPLTPESESNIAYLIEFMKGYPESLDSKARNLYCHAASGLYKLLIGPNDSYTDTKNLLIIPDGSLSYLPFEALLKPQIEPYKQDYRKLPYLIRNHSVCYGLTATIFFNKPTRKANPTRRILAVAPEYDFSSGKISEYIRKAQPGLPELSGTYEESRAIRKLLGGRLLSGDKATEEKFKSIAPKYAILHLAMHSIPDHTNSLNSSLVFTPGADKDEDGVLFGHEVYNMSLNNSLTVLSACETGSGQMASGEGVLSFGRAFISAGCPNLIMTLWTVDDRSSRDIMVQFYKSLVAGSKISDALHDSKLGYLEHSNKLHAHPHYWAGFIELGQNTELNISYRKSGIFILVIVFALTILVLIFVQVKKNPRRSRDYTEKME